MKRVLFRLIAYILAGFSVGFTGWYLLVSNFAFENTRLIIVLLIALIVAIVAILILKKASHIIPEGIRINSSWTVAAMDGVCILASVIASFFIIDGYSSKFTDLAPLIMNDPYALDVIAFMYLPSLLVLAMFVTAKGGQSIAIDKSGLKVSGAFGVKKALWEDIKALRPDEQYVLVSRVGTAIPSRLQTNLDIVTINSETITVYQPGLKKVSREILKKIRKYAPDKLAKDLELVEAAWL